MQEKYLPLGSIVLLDGGKKELMITGYCMETPEKPGKTFDYCGCIHPEGVIRSDVICVFDHSQIKEILFIGYNNEKSSNFIKKLQERTKVQKNYIEKLGDEL